MWENSGRDRSGSLAATARTTWSVVRLALEAQQQHAVRRVGGVADGEAHEARVQPGETGGAECAGAWGERDRLRGLGGGFVAVQEGERRRRESGGEGHDSGQPAGVWGGEVHRSER